jgi:hypothetical protein
MRYTPDKIQQLQTDSISDAIATQDDSVLQPDISVIFYDNLTGNKFITVPLPKRDKISPTSKDYTAGILKRYFIQRKNDMVIIEVGKKQFEYYTDAFLLTVYRKLDLDWKIIGPRNDVVDIMGKILVYGIEDTNLRTLKLKEKEMRGITQTLQNLSEFAIITE